ncbi:conserved hypothetical protein [Uncinocarpus reesii 1704]|uniref:ubiquitinyl hydrolase 1 n=1 Tax=Uncinocarpus reesii (strain UAMH 1704) TaxID=336963 RepID=C4JX67_UNCRE|nr:uncharacterized protein UREG_06240 [Uncinocarpus reesii 1704]EEP81375.1 conserved hypothetical protein [Uncinocarpus reesii 1704]
MYDLIGVDNHFGTLGGGHYTASAKSFVDGNWYEFNDSHVSRKGLNSIVTNHAYLLFYRRRSDHPLGGPYLAKVTEAAYQKNAADSDSPEDSDGNSGEGKRLDGSSRNGSSSALAEAAAAHQAGDGGLQGEILNHSNADDDPPEYLDIARGGETVLERGDGIEGMEIDGYERYGAGPMSYMEARWSFNNVGKEPYYEPNEDMDDDSSVKAFGSGSDRDGQIRPLGSSEGPDPLFSGMDYDNGHLNILNVGDDEDDGNLPVVELPVPDEESSS